jgi:hypothetical protein
VHYFSKLDTALLSALYARELLNNGVVTCTFASYCMTEKFRKCFMQSEFEAENFYELSFGLVIIAENKNNINILITFTYKRDET